VWYNHTIHGGLQAAMRFPDSFVMAATFVLSFVDKLILLEQKTGSFAHNRLMPPFSKRAGDDLS
jgi:hypothetical protein